MFLFKVYVLYLIFLFFSHKGLCDDRNGQTAESVRYTGPSAKERMKKFFRLTHVEETMEGGTSEGPADSNTHLVDRHPNDDLRQGADEERCGTTGTKDDDKDEKIPELSLSTTLVLFFMCAGLVAATAEWLVDSIDGLASSSGISKEFIGLVLLPFVGNTPRWPEIMGSVKGKLGLILHVAVGGSIVSSLPPL